MITCELLSNTLTSVTSAPPIVLTKALIKKTMTPGSPHPCSRVCLNPSLNASLLTLVFKSMLKSAFIRLSFASHCLLPKFLCGEV